MLRNLGERLKLWGGSVKASASRHSASSSVNRRLVELQPVLDEAYLKLGKDFYEKAGDAIPEEYAPLFQSITDILGEMAENKAKLEETQAVYEQRKEELAAQKEDLRRREEEEAQRRREEAQRRKEEAARLKEEERLKAEAEAAAAADQQPEETVQDGQFVSMEMTEVTAPESSVPAEENEAPLSDEPETADSGEPQAPEKELTQVPEEAPSARESVSEEAPEEVKAGVITDTEELKGT